MRPSSRSAVCLLLTLALSACSAADTWLVEEEARLVWLELARYDCIAAIPSAVATRPSNPRPLLIALPDDNETAATAIRRLRSASDQANFTLVAVDWGEAGFEAQALTVGRDLMSIADDLDLYYAVDRQRIFVSSVGRATVPLYEGVFHDSTAFRGAVALGGAPSDPVGVIQGRQTPFYYVIGKLDENYAQEKSFYQALQTQLTHKNLVEVDGLAKEAVLDFSAILAWLAE